MTNKDFFSLQNTCLSFSLKNGALTCGAFIEAHYLWFIEHLIIITFF